MSATIQTIIHCDGTAPGCANTLCDSWHDTAMQQRNSQDYSKDPEATDNSWHYFKRKDYCHVCWKALRPDKASLTV